MTPLEQLFAFEVEFYRRLNGRRGDRRCIVSAHELCIAGWVRGLIPAVGMVSVPDIDVLRARLALRGDPRDVLRARDSVMRILGIDASGR